MSAPVTVAYRRGTWRTRAPGETLATIEPLLPRCGITRCAEVTWLDRVGIPVFCAIRPTAAVLQVANGKGIDRESAMVSALMEAIELFHAENPLPERLSRASAADLAARGRPYLAPGELPGCAAHGYRGDRFELEWVAGEDLNTGEAVQVPAGAVYFHRLPSLHVTTTNGLASGNHPVEATLHALYELIERDAAAALQAGGRIPIRERCQVLDPATVDDPDLAELLRRVRECGSRVVALRVPSRVPVHTFWAVLLDERSGISGSTFNTGWGTHGDAAVALSRALTEAVQSRATMIHGAREDALLKPVYSSAADARNSKAFGFFRDLPGDTPWSDLRAPGLPLGDDLEADLQVLLAALDEAGVQRVVCCDLTLPEIGVPVTKVLAPGLGLRHG